MRDLKGKRLLILGGSLWKEAIKQFAVEHEIVLIATGNDRSAGIFEIADEKYEVNSTDAESMKRLIKEKKIDGVYMGGAEVVIGAACQYLEELGIPCYCTYEQWNMLQNKKNFKELCIRNRLPVVPKYEFQNGDIRLANDVFPVITKPKNTDFLARNITAFDKSKTEQISNPFRIFCIIFVAFHRLYPFRIGNDNVDIIFQKIKDRNPVFTCGFHADIMAIIVEKPLLEFKN